MSWWSNLRRYRRAHSAFARGLIEWERLYVSLLAQSLTTAALIRLRIYAF